jgi:hypothetical protein
VHGGPIQHGFLPLELPNQTLHLGPPSVEDALDPFEEYDTVQRFEATFGQRGKTVESTAGSRDGLEG